MWKSKRQSCITDSSAASETVAMSLGAREILPIRRLLRQMDYLPTKKSILFEDNVSAGQFALRLGRRHKYLSLKQSYIQELVDRRLLTIVLKPSKDQLSDVLTKAHAEGTFNSLWKRIYDWKAKNELPPYEGE